MKYNGQQKINIRKKLIEVNLYRTVIPMMLMSVLLMVFIASFVGVQINYRSKDIINSIESSTSRYLNHYASSLDEVYFSLYKREEFSETLQDSIRAYIKSNAEITNIWILDSNGRVVAGAPTDNEKIGYDQSGRDYFKALKNVGDTYWSDVFVSYESNLPIVTVAKRFEDAFVVIRVDMESLTDFISVFDITENSYIVVTDKSGAYLAHSDYSFVNTRAYDPNRMKLLANGKLQTTYNGNYMWAYHKILSDTNWSVILYQSVWDLVIPVLMVIGLGVLFILVISMTVVKSILGLTQEISSEVENLVSWTNEVALGHYDIEINSGTTEEFETLKDAFKSMIKGVLTREELLEEQREEIIEINEGLEAEVKKRTEDLEKSLVYLQNTQEQLVQKEKMAALGSLVSGVAHELNTPIGVTLTAGSYLEKRNKALLDQLAEGRVSKHALTRYVETVNDSTQIVLRNMERASGLISSFKKVAVDQERMSREEMYLKDIVDATVTSLGVELKRRNIETHITYEGHLKLKSYPGAISQIIANLIQNSLIHAFDQQLAPKIGIDCREGNAGDDIVIIYWDNGSGIDRIEREKVYDPFYTTAEGTGGTGLGMNIVYNLVNGLLLGRIDYIDDSSYGVCFEINLPKIAQ